MYYVCENCYDNVIEVECLAIGFFGIAKCRCCGSTINGMKDKYHAHREPYYECKINSWKEQ